jgi:hypothetical protein
MTLDLDDATYYGRYAAFGGLALTLLGLPMIGISESGCEFVGSATQDYTGTLSEPGNTFGLVAFTLAPLRAIIALFLLTRADKGGRPRSGLAFAAALLVFPLAGLNFFYWAAKGAFGCGLGL